MTVREHPECKSCICGRRAMVQGNNRIEKGQPGHGAGTISWAEHELAWATYAQKHGRDQTAERIDERGGFDWLELIELLRRPPETWAPRGTAAERERYR